MRLNPIALGVYFDCRHIVEGPEMMLRGADCFIRLFVGYQAPFTQPNFLVYEKLLIHTSHKYLPSKSGLSKLSNVC